MATTYLTRVENSTQGSANKATFSAWVKKTSIATNYPRIISILPSSNNGLEMYFRNTDVLEIKVKFNGAVRALLTTNRLFRDVNAWYHILLSIDSTSGTADDRIRLYVNGVKETSFSARTNPDQNANIKISAPHTFQIGGEVGSSGNRFSGLMSHVHWCDGAALAPTVFGETDSTTGEWKIKTSPSFTPGTNGFTILKDGNTITDQSANSNNFSLGGGTLTNTKDCPSNVMATMNPLSTNDANGNFTNGNTANSTGASSWRTMFSTLGASSGKWYCEMKYVSGSNQMFGIFSLDKKSNVKNIGYVGDNNSGTQAVGLAKGGDYYINGNTSTYTGGSNTSWTTGDIIQIALDRDNSKVYFGKNGTWMGSGNPASGSTGTGAISFSPDSNSFWGFATSVNASASATNFGNGFFGTTAITTNSGNGYAGAEGASKFNYAVPSGYSALSTKGLNT